MNAMKQLTTAVPASDTTYGVYVHNGGVVELVWDASSTAGTGSPVLSLQRRPKGGAAANWTQVGSGSSLAQLTAAGTICATLGACELRVVLSASSGATINYDLIRAMAGRVPEN
jgi:hypothetical protein